MHKATKSRPDINMQAFLIFLVLLLAFSVLNGCSQNDTGTTTVTGTATTSSQESSSTAPSTLVSESTQPTVTSSPTPTPVPTGVPILNPLTGLALPNENSEGLRPIAIMINNHRKAVPQIGLSAADLLYELPVEAGITRFLAVFTDASAVPEVGPVRSARHNYIDVAGGLDAILVHIGMSYIAREQFIKQKPAHIDLGVYSNAGWRDAVWKAERGTEHSVKTNGTLLAKAIDDSGFRTEIKDSQEPAFVFRNLDEFVAVDGQDALKVTIPYSTYTVATFDYDTQTRLYSKGEFGKPQIDLATGQPLQFTNVFIILTRIVSIDNSVLKDISLAKGNGFYISGGKSQAIAWQKGSTNDPFVFKDLDGNVLQVNCGKSYIGIAPTQTKVVIGP